jgi:DNA polymerase-3 subunit delta
MAPHVRADLLTRGRFITHSAALPAGKRKTAWQQAPVGETAVWTLRREPVACAGRERELAEWCQRRAQEAYRIQLAADAARLLAWRCPPDLGVLDQELAKLGVAATGVELTAGLVPALTPASREERVLSVVAAVAERRARDALSTLRQVLEQGENPVGILALLTGQVRELATARRALQERKTAAAYAKERDIDPWRAERLLAQAA